MDPTAPIRSPSPKKPGIPMQKNDPENGSGSEDPSNPEVEPKAGPML